MYKIFSINIIIIILSCNPSKNSPQTEVFSIYLKEIEREIPKSSHLYIIAPRLSCSGCVQQLATNVENNIDALNKKNISIITSKADLFSDKATSKVNYYLDKKEDIDYIDMDLYNITLIETVDKQVKKIIHLEVEDGNKFVEYLNKYK
jgi:GTPase involved in cell partitioning and DNA repair